MVVPRIVTDAIALILMRTIASKLTALYCGADFIAAIVFEP
jgi:hypothetical protein